MVITIVIVTITILFQNQYNLNKIGFHSKGRTVQPLAFHDNYFTVAIIIIIAVHEYI